MYLYAINYPAATEPDRIYSLYGVAQTYFELPDPARIAGDFWLITWFGEILHYHDGVLVDKDQYPARQDSRFVWYLPAQVPASQF